MPDPRPQGPQRTHSYPHRYGAIHDSILADEKPDDTFYNKISNKRKVDYMCTALRLSPTAFNLDLQLPFEDWAMSEDMSMLNCGLYLSDLRRQFYSTLLVQNPAFQDSPAWVHHAEAEFWGFEFNSLLAKRGTGVLIRDGRVLN